MRKTITALFAFGLASLTWCGLVKAQYEPPTYVNPMPNGGYVITQPGAQPYQPPKYMNPLPNGGYVIVQPGALPYEPPIYINPLPNGGSIITQPGAAPRRGGYDGGKGGND